MFEILFGSHPEIELLKGDVVHCDLWASLTCSKSTGEEEVRLLHIFCSMCLCGLMWLQFSPLFV